MPWLLPNTSLLPLCPFLVPNLRAGRAEHLQTCHHHAAAGRAHPDLHLSRPSFSLVISNTVPPPASHWSSAVPPRPLPLIGQWQCCPSPGVSFICGSSAGCDWLSHCVRERPLGAGCWGPAVGGAGDLGGSRCCPGSSVGNMQIIFQDGFSDKAVFICDCNGGRPASRSAPRKQRYIFSPLLPYADLFLPWFLNG